MTDRLKTFWSDGTSQLNLSNMSEINKRRPACEPEEARDAKRQANEETFKRCIQVLKTRFGDDPLLTEDPYYIILDNLPRLKGFFNQLACSMPPFFRGAARTLEICINDEEEEENEFDTKIVKLAGLQDESDDVKDDFRIMLMDEEAWLQDATSTPYIMRKERYAGEDVELAPPLHPNQSLMIELNILVVQHCEE